jgi:hypothetical protein
MDTRKLILYYNDNYADEFDVSGYDVITKHQYDRIMVYMQNYFKVKKRYEWSFGTNEEIHYRSYDEFYSAFDTRLISEEDYLVLAKLGLTSSGSTPTEHLIEVTWEEGDE